MPQGKLSEIEEEKRQTELYILSLIDDGKGKRGVAKKGYLNHISSKIF